MSYATRYLRVFLLASFCLCGCHNPARQPVPRGVHAQRETEWRQELAPGEKADRALAYLLTEGFDCRVTRDERARVEQITATLPSALRDASGEKRNWRIVLGIDGDVIQTAEITPLSPSR